MPLTMLVSTRLPDHVAAALRGVGPELTLVPFDEQQWPSEGDRAQTLLTWSLTGPEIALALDRAPGVTWIQSDFAGVNSLLLPAVFERDITITNASGAHAPAIAEWVMMLILAFAKRLPALMDLKARRAWVDHRSEELGGATVGIVGAGNIGREVARRARAFDLRVLALRRHAAPTEGADEVFTPDRVTELVSRSDFVVCTAPLTPATRGLVGRREIAAMKPTAHLINVGRGPVVDEAALAEALAERRIAGAGLDVFEHEPLPPDNPFWALDNVILSPHCCDHTPHTDGRVLAILVENLRRHFAGEPLRNVVDKRAGY